MQTLKKHDDKAGAGGNGWRAHTHTTNKSTTHAHKKVLNSCPIDSTRAARHAVNRKKQRTPQAPHNAVLMKALTKTKQGREERGVHEVRWEPGEGAG